MSSHTSMTRRLILMFTLVAAIALVALVAPLAGQQPGPEAATRPAATGEPDLTKEPPQEFVLEIGGKSIEVLAERPFDLEVAGQTLPARLVPKPDRLFSTGEISFRYPNDFAFAYDPSGDAPSWEFDGTNTVLTVLRYDAQLTPDELVETIVDSMNEQFGNRKAKTKTTSIRLAGRNVAGKRMTSTLVGTKLQHDVFGFTAGGRPYVLIIQDTLTDAGKRSAETAETVALLTKTFTFLAPPVTAPATPPQ